MTTTIQPGDTVTGLPYGQKRRQTFVVTAVIDNTVLGLLVSKKYPGDYRGKVGADIGTCEKVSA